MFLSLRRIAFHVLILLAISASAGAFQANPEDARETFARRKPPVLEVTEDTPRADVRVDASLVMIPVRVTTDLGTSVTNLGRKDFHLFEDSVEQTITTFAKDDAPLSVGIIFDSSGSMRNKMKKSLEAISAFFRNANPDDEFFLIEFNDRPRLTVPFTSDWSEVYRRVAKVRPFGCTSLYDALQTAVVQMKKAKNTRKAVLIISDGGDNRSRHSFKEIRNNLLEADVLVYAIGIFDQNAEGLTPEEKNGPKLLDELAGQTGGRHYPTDDLDSLPEISSRIGLELRNQYLVGFTPESGTNDGKFHRVKVTLAEREDQVKLRISHRNGYQAPAN